MNTFRFLTGLAIAAAVGALSLLILQAEDQPAVISQNPATPEPLVTTVESSAPEPAATSVDSAPARSKMPDVSGVWLYNGEKTVAQFRPAEEAEAIDFRLVIDGQKKPFPLKWSAERRQFEATFEADRGPGTLLLKPTRDGRAFRGLMLVDGETTSQELIRGVIDGQTVRPADEPAAGKESDNVLVLETSVGLAAYNQKSGQWHREEVAAPKDKKSRISHTINSRNFASVHFDDQLLVFSSPADKWTRLTIPAGDIDNVSIFHRGDQFSVQVGFTKYELTAAGELVATEVLAPPTVAESVDDKPFGSGALPDRPAVSAASSGPPNITGQWVTFSLPSETHAFSVLHRITHNSKQEFEVLLQFQEGADQFVTRRMPIPWDAKKHEFRGSIPFPFGGKGNAAYTIKTTDRPDGLLVDIVWDDAAKKSIGGGTMEPAGQKFGEFHQRWVRTLPIKGSQPSKTIAGQWLSYKLPAESHTFSLLHRIDPLSDSESYRVVLQFQEGVDKFITRPMPLKWDAAKRQYRGVIPFPLGGKEQGTATYTLKPNDQNNEFQVDIVWDDKAKKLIGERGAIPADYPFGEFHERWLRVGPEERANEEQVKPNAVAAPISDEITEAKTDPAMPDITGIWSTKTASPSFNRCSVTAAPSATDHHFILTASHRQLWHLTWQPGQKVFEAIHPSDPKSPPVIWKPVPEEKVLLRYDVKPDEDWKANLEQILKREATPAARFEFQSQYEKIEGFELIITETATGLAAYSKLLGRWDRLEVDSPKDGGPRIQHFTVGFSSAGGVIDDQLLGYSGKFGRWGRMTIPEKYVGKVQPTVGGGGGLGMGGMGGLVSDSLSAQVGHTFYMFSGQTGQWTSAEDANALATGEKPETKTDPAMPDITGVWFAQENRPSFSQCSVTPAPESAGYHFILTSVEREIWHLTWQPEQNVFEAVKASDPAAPHVLWKKWSEGNALQRYALKPNEDWKATWETVDRAPAPSDRFHYQSRYFRIEGKDLIVTETETGLSAYSKSLGRWDAIEVERPKDGAPRMLEMTVGFHFAGGVIDNHLLGYSSQFGRWGRMTIPEKHVGQVKTNIGVGGMAGAGGDNLSAQVGDKFYVFSGQTGQWTSPDSPSTNANEAVKSTLKPGMPDISGLWNRLAQVDGDGFPKISRAKANDSCDFILRWTAESKEEQLTWKEEDRIFENTQRATKSPASGLLHVSADGKTFYFFGQVAKEERKELLDRIHRADMSPEELQTQTPNVFHFQDRLVSDEFIMIESNDGLDAFSKITGSWDRLQIGLPEDHSPRLTEVLGSAHFATTVVDNQLLGYSSQAGKWGRMTIPPELVGQVVPIHSQNIVTVKIGDKTYALSPKTGQWLSPDGKPVPNSERPQSDITSPPTSFSDIAPRKSSTKLTTPEARKLAEQLQAREQEAATLAEQLREQFDEFGKHHPHLWKAHRDPNPATCLVCHAESSDKEKLQPREKLMQTLSAALDLKFQLEQLQIRDLQARLSQLEQQIGQRKAQRDKIVQRRAQELIDGDDTRWNSSEGPTDSARSGNTRRAQSAAPSPPSTSVHFQGPSSLSVFIPSRTVMLGEGHGYEFLHGPGEFLTYALSLKSNEWKSRISADLDIYSTNDSIRKFLDKHHVWFHITDEDVDQIESGNFVTKVAYLPHTQLQVLANAQIETLVSTRLDPQLDPLEEAKKRGEILAVLRLKLQQPDTETPKKDAANSNQLAQVPQTETSLDDYASAESRCWNELGLKFGEKETVFLSPHDGRYGIAVKEVKDDGPASAAGIRLGYILVGLGQWETRSVKDILWILNNRPPEPTLKAYVYQGEEILTALLQVAPKTPAAKPAPVPSEAGLSTEEAPIANSPIPSNVEKDADLDLPARLAKAEGEFKKALLDFNRIQTLSTKNVTTRQELDLATNRRDSAAKQYQALQLQYAVVWRDLELQIKAAQIQHDAAAREISRVERRAENLTPLEKATLIEQANIQYEQSALALERLKSRYDFFKQAGEGLAYGPHAKKDPPNWDDKSPLQAPAGTEIADDALAAKARDFWEKIGIKLEPVTAQSLGAFSEQFQGGLRVIEIRPDSPAAKTDIRVGDIWVGVGRWQTTSFRDLVWINDQPLDAEGNTRIVRRIRDGKVWPASYSLSFGNDKK